MSRLKAIDEIHLTDRQKQVLFRLTQQQKAEQRLVQRAQILLLADQQKANSQIANFLHIKRDTAIKWRRRWNQQTEELSALEQEPDEKCYMQGILSIISDVPRPGAPITFEAEAVCQIFAIACQTPEASQRPITHWSARELRDEVLERGIVPNISIRTVGRFLKSSGIAAASNRKLDSTRNNRPRRL